jgi:hypothetical protein
MTAQTPNKHDVLLNLLEDGRNVTVHLDPRRSGVVCPRQFQRDTALPLVVGYNLPRPIPDLVIEEDGFGCTLSFGGRPEWCFVPWGSVFGMVATIGSVVWPNDVPEDFTGSTPPGARRPAGPRVTPLLPPAPGAASGATGATIIDMMAYRAPKDRRACEKRLGLVRPAPLRPEGGSAA